MIGTFAGLGCLALGLAMLSAEAEAAEDAPSIVFPGPAALPGGSEGTATLNVSVVADPAGLPPVKAVHGNWSLR